MKFYSCTQHCNVYYIQMIANPFPQDVSWYSSLVSQIPAQAVTGLLPMPSLAW